MMPRDRGATMLRVITGLLLAGLAAFLLWTPGLHIGLTLFAAALVAIGLHEYYGMTRALELETESLGGIIAGAVLVLSACRFSPLSMPLVLTAALIALTTLHLFRGRHSLIGVAATLLGVVYAGWGGAHFIALHAQTPHGPGYATLVVVAVALSDTGAYFAGISFGKHKLAPIISPKKTWEGAVGGVLAASAGGAALFALRPWAGFMCLPDWSLGVFIASGVLLAIIAMIGDLFESMLKRSAGVKDSGELLPGHGGALDRCDGFLFAAPALYYVLSLFP